MATKLDKLLQSIDPSRTFDKVSADVDRAVNSFSVRRAKIEDWEEFHEFLADFFRHIESFVLKLGSKAPPAKSLHLTQCLNILEKKYGSNGWKTAFEMVRTGKNGGLYKIIKIIADQMIENYAQNVISARITYYLQDFTLDERDAEADEYLKKFGHLLPSDFTDANGVRLKVQFPSVLNEHPKIILRMRQIGR